MTSATTDNQRCKGASFPKLLQSAQNGNQNSCASFSQPEKKRQTERKRVEAVAATTDHNQTATFWCKHWKQRILDREGSRVDRVYTQTIFQNHVLNDNTAQPLMDLSLIITHYKPLMAIFYGTQNHFNTWKKERNITICDIISKCAKLWMNCISAGRYLVNSSFQVLCEIRAFDGKGEVSFTPHRVFFQGPSTAIFRSCLSRNQLCIF